MNYKRTDTTFCVAERSDNYKTVLIREMQGEETEIGLWVVVVTSALGTWTVHVLAESEASAECQARCHRNVEAYRTEKLEITTIARRIPVLLRGWGGREF